MEFTSIEIGIQHIPSKGLPDIISLGIIVRCGIGVEEGTMIC
jgi:hypothetical protein